MKTILRPRVLGSLYVVLLTAAGSAQAPTEHGRSVRFVYELRNPGPAPLTKVELRLVLPPDLPRQRVELLRVGPRGKVVSDPYRNRVAIFAMPRLEAGESFVAQWFASVRLRDVVVEPKRGVEPLPKQERTRFLRDLAAYRLDDPWLRKTARKAVAGLDDRFQTIAALHDLVLRRMSYVRDGRWDPAPVCLRRGEGSCTEYTYAFVALCRTVGIPARWAGGTALRDQDRVVYEDRVFHRWAEVWLEDRGWYPVDCSRNDGEDGGVDRRRYFGRVPWPLLVLARGDGGPESLTGWAYHARGKWGGSGGRSHRRGYWTREISEVAFRDLEKQMARGRIPEPRAPEVRQAWLFLRGRGIDPDPVETVPRTSGVPLAPRRR